MGRPGPASPAWGLPQSICSPQFEREVQHLAKFRVLTAEVWPDATPCSTSYRARRKQTPHKQPRCFVLGALLFLEAPTMCRGRKFGTPWVHGGASSTEDRHEGVGRISLKSDTMHLQSRRRRPPHIQHVRRANVVVHKRSTAPSAGPDAHALDRTYIVLRRLVARSQRISLH